MKRQQILSSLAAERMDHYRCFTASWDMMVSFVMTKNEDSEEADDLIE